MGRVGWATWKMTPKYTNGCAKSAEKRFFRWTKNKLTTTLRNTNENTNNLKFQRNHTTGSTMTNGTDVHNVATVDRNEIHD